MRQLHTIDLRTIWRRQEVPQGRYMMLSSMIYVSRSLLSLPEDIQQLANVQNISAARNRDLDLSGLIIVTSRHFAQYLEGNVEAVSTVVRSITRDPRHAELMFMDIPRLALRRFPDWRMAWFGPSDAIEQKMRPFLGQVARSGRHLPGDQLLQLMEEISHAHTAIEWA